MIDDNDPYNGPYPLGPDPAPGRQLEMAGLCVVLAGGTLAEAYAADDRANTDMEAALKADSERAELLTRKLKLTNADLQTRIEARLERKRRRAQSGSAGSGPGDAA